MEPILTKPISDRREFIRDALGAAALGALGGCNAVKPGGSGAAGGAAAASPISAINTASTISTEGTAGTASAAGSTTAAAKSSEELIGYPYPGWTPGELDIHLIHTGTGENTFMIFPDGTTMLLDCGYNRRRPPDYADAIPPAPDGTRRGGEWVRRYIERLGARREIDYLVVSHWHADHFAGIPDVSRTFRFLNYYDHQYPDVGKYRLNADMWDFDQFQSWLTTALGRGMKREPFNVGALNQIRLRFDPWGKYGESFSIRNIAANGVVWDGKDGLVDCAAEHVKATGATGIQENMLSSVLLIRYGAFSYFTGGDLEGGFVGADGKSYLYEARVGEVAGPVQVCKTNHHAYWTAMQDGFIKAVRPKLFVSSSWSPNQQNLETLKRMMSPENYEGTRFVAYGAIPDFRMREFRENGLDKCLTPAGHSVVKVEPGGAAFKLYTLSAADESMRVIGVREFTCS